VIATVENFRYRRFRVSISVRHSLAHNRLPRAVKSLREGGRVLYAKHQCCDGGTAEDQRVESNDESLFRVTALLTGGKI
jgi:hypothetical protein